MRVRKAFVLAALLGAFAASGVIVGKPHGTSNLPGPSGGAEASPSGPDGATPLQMAMLDDDYGAFVRLLRAGADPNIVGWHGTTVVHLAARHRNGHYLERVLEHGGNPNAVALRLKRTPLFFALDSRRPDNRDLLIERGANIEYADATNTRPLRHAANIADVDSVLRLLELGADPAAVDDIGSTFQSSLFRINPEHLRWEVRRRYRTIMSILEARGIPLDPQAESFR